MTKLNVYSPLFNKHVDRVSYMSLQISAVADEIGETMQEAVRSKPWLYPFCGQYLVLSCLPTSFGLWATQTSVMVGGVLFHPRMRPLRQRLCAAMSGDEPLRRYASCLQPDAKNPEQLRLDKSGLSREVTKNTLRQYRLAKLNAWQGVKDIRTNKRKEKERSPENGPS